MAERTDRGQLATSLVEATVGALLLLSVVAGFLWVPVGDAPDARLDRHAADALAVLDAEPPAGTGRSRLSAACRSPAAFATERTELAARLDAVLPAAAFGRLETPYGAVGPAPPAAVSAGTATRSTGRCVLSLRVWVP
ncbi:DUF7262 family protein [Halobellus clavatus]|uniref:Uncharacterized protein n=1 Tax=Halobellus clavatus TaxID=660517 RepID=A0A1H3CYG6_9EURY|nr:hypothetical protein [Halobellus clavatus]SDX59126.1 hypothetical protein SAMN04487946_101264 [Halobellus clavatus]